ncbi:hypothetical protein HN51_020674 [Arachis hypogaea]|uniref:Uncharacterized protein LOC110274751 n=1 Tax=Arachis duranensis TaxID=130453 RepID=A0A9C6T8W7_ARADU|nr:uncharacterized protein LOC110274751 [Arachis duranensis]
MKGILQRRQSGASREHSHCGRANSLIRNVTSKEIIEDLNEKKVEALKEMWGASILMQSEEYIGARKKLLSAQKLYPELDNINLMLTICDILLLASIVRLSSGNEIHLDCILDLIYPSATYSDARCYLHDLVTLINGIKDEFPGSELALEIVKKALDMVSDKEKRFHDHHFRKKNDAVSWNEVLDGESTESASTLEKDFPNLEIPFEHRSLEGSLIEDQECQQKQEFYNFEEERNAILFEPNQIWAIHYQHDEVKFNQCPYAKINVRSGDFLSVTWLKPVPFNDDERMLCNAGFPLACGVFCLDTNACDDHVRTKIFSYKCCWNIGLMNDQNQHQIEIYPKRGEIWAVYKDGVLDDWRCNPEELKRSKLGFIEMLSDYSKCKGGDFVPLEKVNGFCSVFKRLTCGRKSPTLFHVPPQKLFLFSHKILSHRLIGGRDEALFELDQMALPNNLIFKDTNPCDVGEKSLSKCGFSTGQVWAIYCGKDMMPRQYVLVNSVISNKHVCVTLLEHELENFEKRLIGDRFIACGMFKPCNSKVMLNMSRFSHLVNYVNGATRPQQHYMIYPKKGEIWAVYKNWDRNWGNDDYEKCRFGIVEIISDFSKENGIRVAKLEEVQNCVTFFWMQKHEGFDLCFTVFEADMHRFSHQVIAYRVPGIEMYGIPEDSWHLEPQAIPNQ